MMWVLKELIYKVYGCQPQNILELFLNQGLRVAILYCFVVFLNPREQPLRTLFLLAPKMIHNIFISATGYQTDQRAKYISYTI